MAETIYKLIRNNRTQNLDKTQTYKPPGEGYSDTGVTGTLDELDIYIAEDRERRRQESERKSNRDKKS